MAVRPGSHIRNPRRGTVSEQVFGALNFTPALLRPVAWYDAADTATITESSGAVSQWNDKSGNGYNILQATGANQPTTGTRTQNNRNVIDFDGSNDQLRTNGQVITQITTSKALTQIVVCKSDRTNVASEGIVGAQRGNHDYNSGWLQERRTTFLSFTIGIGGTDINSATQYNAARFSNSSTSPMVFAVHVSAADSTKATEVNNVSQTLTTYDGTMVTSNFMSAGSANHQLNVGNRGSLSQPFDGWIGEILLFDRFLTINERNALISFLNAKWGIY
jgi:hypothetical protein